MNGQVRTMRPRGMRNLAPAEPDDPGIQTDEEMREIYESQRDEESGAG